ncbi:serine hydrolase [Flavobacteriaceae bacterium Ap0902]|nr:serine hydrolase [Flavobacteriaceae bacterium Ap0902]
MAHKILALFMMFLTFQTSAQTSSPLYIDDTQMQWVDSLYQEMTLDEKIGQLFMVAAYSNKSDSHEQKIIDLIEKENIGGLIFMQDNPTRQVQLINKYQTLTKYPLLIGMDAEWDVSMRLKNTNQFPWAMTSAALSNENLLMAMGNKVSEHLQRVGAHFNFAPVADVNVNPLNPIIGNRAYGSDPDNVAAKGLAYATAMQNQQILASAKHFPGHGDTDKDSHKTLPTLLHTRERLDSIELKPFQKLIDGGISSIMIAHLNVPSLEPNKSIPASLSKNIVTGLLKEEMGFEGIIITDALNMQGVTKNYPNGEIDYMAFEAGNDILLFSQAVSIGKEKIKNAIGEGKITESRLEESVKKILMAKYWVGLNEFVPISTENLSGDLNDEESLAITQKIFEESATLIQNKADLLPIVNLKDKKFAWIGLEEGHKDTFYTYLNKYTQVDKINPNSKSILSDLNQYDYVFLSVHKDNATPYKSYKISNKSRTLIQRIAQHSKVILTVFGSPYALKNVEDLNIESIIVAYQNHEFAMQAVPQLIFGAIPFRGKLPVTLNAKYSYGTCIQTKPINRLGYTLPENVGSSSVRLQAIDEIALDAIRQRATPGIQLLVAKKGKVIYDKSYGYHTYDKKKAVSWNSLYDVASITKVVSTLPLLMDQIEKKGFSLDEPLRNLVPRAIFSDKSNITAREILAHQAGLYPWIPFYKNTLDSLNHKPLRKYYRNTLKSGFEIQVAKDLYLVNYYPDSMLNQIFSKESIPKRYKYSDLGYYLFKDFLERSKLLPIDQQIQQYFYQSLGMNLTTYNPLNKFALDQIVPTENDQIYRNQLIHGYVHDQGAAMLGGIAGHAGVFSNANDLAKIMQMYMNLGFYGGKQYLKESTLKEFSKFQYRGQGNRRGLGFDKQLGSQGPAVPAASSDAYGHSGFTGTLVWVDPAKDLVFVFLSNRIHPSAENRKLIQLKTRKKILEKIYQVL